jgi:hypothetical protein
LIFGNASGLRINFAKCSITPIYGTDEVISQIQAVLPFQVSQFPITYLGVPLSTTTIPKASFRPLVEKVARKLPRSSQRRCSQRYRLICSWLTSCRHGLSRTSIAYDEGSCGLDRTHLCVANASLLGLLCDCRQHKGAWVCKI